MKISRDIATPLTIGAFMLMSVTGALMFFHWDRGLNKAAHEWLGWAMVTGAALHVAVNWPPFKRYLVSNRLAQAIVGFFIVVLVASFFVTPPAKEAPPHVMALRGVLAQPLPRIAALNGKTLEQLTSDLAQVGISSPDANATLGALVGQDRHKQAKAIRVIFGER